MNAYINYDLHIIQQDQNYLLHADCPLAGQVNEQCTPPFSDEEIEILCWQDTAIQSDPKEIGRRLYDAIFQNAIGQHLHRSLAIAADTQGQRLRIRLHLNQSPQLACLPWEYLYDPARDNFFALSTQTPIVRYLDLPVAESQLMIDGPLQILVILSDPVDLEPRLDVEQEWGQMQATFQALQKAKKVILHHLPNVTRQKLQRYLREHKVDILHFIGHGRYDEQDEEGFLAVEDSNGQAELLSADVLAYLLKDSMPRLVYLNSCETARGSLHTSLAGTAQKLVQKGLPAAIAMQASISDTRAGQIAHEFYLTLMAGHPVDVALAEGRKAIFNPDELAEWGIPVLFMRVPDGDLGIRGGGEMKTRLPNQSPGKNAPDNYTEVVHNEGNITPVVHNEGNITPVGHNEGNIGNNNVIIKRLTTIPRWLIILIMLMIISGAVWMVWPKIAPFLPIGTMPEGKFNIAVAEWRLEDRDSILITDRAKQNQARNMAINVAEFLNDKRSMLTDGEVVEVWGPNKRRINSVKNDREAKNIANDLNASVLIYVKVRIEQDVWKINPRFYIGDDNRRQSLTVARELIGPYALGNEITDYTHGHLNKTLRNRLTALISILSGIRYMTHKRPDYSLAISEFEKLLSEEENVDAYYWPSGEEDGQEILYHFLGNAYLRKARYFDVSQAIEKKELYIKSQDAYNQAIRLNSDYARSYNGLGSVHNELALQIGNCTVEETDHLQKSNTFYDHALGAGPIFKPSHAYVNNFAYAGKAAVETRRGTCAISIYGLDHDYVHIHYQTAIKYYEKVIQADGEHIDSNDSYRYLLIYTYIGLAKVEFKLATRLSDQRSDMQSHMINASEAYEQAFKLIEQKKIEININQGIEVIHEYLMTLCLQGQTAHAENFLDGFLETIIIVNGSVNIDKFQDEILNKMTTPIIQSTFDGKANCLG